MNTVIKIINQLENTNGTNDKIQIIKDNSDNETFKKVLYYTYADNLQYGFSEKLLRKKLEETKDNIIEKTKIWNNSGETIFDMLDELSHSNINDSLRGWVYNDLNHRWSEYEELLIRILTKDLRCNISAKTINKAIKGLIPTWDVQKGTPIDKVKLKENEWIALSVKENGIRSTFMNGVFRSRQNKEQLGFNHISNDIISLGLEDYVLDGELIRNNIDNIEDNENFRLTTSIVNSDKETKNEIIFKLFDILPVDEFITGESKDTFKARLELLNNIKNKIDELGLNNIKVVDTLYTGTDHAMIDIVLDKLDSEGYEGAMCLRDMPYKCKRNNGILKCKKFKSADCKIIGYEEGTGKLQGMLGSFIIDYKGNNVSVGSGYTDNQRIEYWNDRDNLIGRVLEVKYKEESKNTKTGLLSLQFPIFVCIREEGKEISYN